MRFDTTLLALSLLGSAAASAFNTDKIPRAEIQQREPEAPDQELYKRRGGGGGGGRGGGSSGGGGSKSGSGSGSSSGSGSGSGKSGSGSSTPGNTRTTSNAGGRSTSGSGPAPSFVGGKYYSGGAAQPYTAGRGSPAGIAPYFLAGSAIAFWPGAWLYGAHVYPYGHYRDDDDDEGEYIYKFHNDSSGQDEEREVLCACASYNVCGCDKNDDTEAYLDELVGNGSYAALNKSIINVARVNDTTALLINGTLPNGTTVADPDASDAGDSAAGGMRSLVEALGFWPAIAAVGATVLLA